jgi:hypothetical protein
MATNWFSIASTTCFLLTSCIAQDTRVDPRLTASFIGTLLNNAKTSGSLVYSGRCDNNGGSSDLPELRMPLNRDVSSLQILREMFIGDPKMQVVQESDGKIRMVERDVPTDILDLKIRHISFTTHPDPINSAGLAMWAIRGAPEVQAFMKSGNIGPPPRDVYRLTTPAPPVDAPRISGDLENVTVSQALDYILETYPGFWAYENCQGERGGRTIFLRFFPRNSASLFKFP